MVKTTQSPHHGANFRLDEAPLSLHGGGVRADDYDDVYFSADDGLAESHHVFIEGNRLAERLGQQSQMTIAETGFGTGLNFLAVLQVLDQFPDRHIDFVSCELRPLAPHIMRQAHAAFPSAAAASAELLAVLPPRWPGVHLCQLRQGRVRLHLLYGPAEAMLSDAEFSADAWFLDGFSPAKNPELWTDNMLTQVGRLTRSGGTVASFTAASAVRQRLMQAGFAVAKRPGFGRKREMIAGIKTGPHQLPFSVPCDPVGSVGIIGGGIAGAAVAAGLRHRGVTAIILDAGSGLASAASGNKLALQSPRLTVDHNLASRLSASCLSYAARCSDLAGATIASRVLSLDWPAREAVRQTKFAEQCWPDDLLRAVDADAASGIAGIAVAQGGVVHDYGRVIDPLVLCKDLAAGTTQIFGFDVTQIIRDACSLLVVAADGRKMAFDKLVIASGAGVAEMLHMLGIGGVRVDVTAGQVSHVPAQPSLACLNVGLSFGGYLTPSYNGFHELGATFDRTGRADFDDSAFLHNRNLLPPDLAHLLVNLDDCAGRISRRASPPDRAPVCGRLDDRLYVLGGLGARGLNMAPLLGTMLAAMITDMPATLGRQIDATLDPFRFRMRRGL